MEGNSRRSAILGSRGTDESKTSKVNIHQLMNKIFIDTSTDTKKEYINKKSEEFAKKLGFKEYKKITNSYQKNGVNIDTYLMILSKDN